MFLGFWLVFLAAAFGIAISIYLKRRIETFHEKRNEMKEGRAKASVPGLRRKKPGVWRAGNNMPAGPEGE